MNFGRWVADCPADCGSALKLSANQSMYHCVECGQLAGVEWPTDADEIWLELSQRPAPKNRNWFPSGHVLALKSGSSHGQTPRQLREETETYMGGAHGLDGAHDSGGE